MQRGRLVFRLHTVFGEQRVDVRFVGFSDVRQNDVLICRQTEFDFGEFFRDQPQRGFQPVAFHVLDASGFDEEREKPFSIHSLVPAVKVAGAGEFERPGGFKFDVGALFDFGARPVRAAFRHDVFQAGVLAVGTVAEIAVNREHGLHNFDKFFRFEKTDDIREARIGGIIAVAAAHAAADGDIVASESFVLDDGDEAEAIGENVLVIHRRNGERNLEFSRQIRFAVKRVREIFVLRLFEIKLLAVNPDGVISPGLRRKRQGDAAAILKDLLAHPGVGGRGRGEHIAVHVAARGERGEQRFVDGFDDRAQVGLEDAVELDGLARGDTQRVVAML